MFEFVDENRDLRARIKVVGVGGGGGNAINNMIRVPPDERRVHIGKYRCPGLEDRTCTYKDPVGSGGYPWTWSRRDRRSGKAGEESDEHIREAVADADMVFVTAGMGGGTGTGCAPVVARIARELGALTVGVVTKPFDFEGKVRMKNAVSGLEELKKCVDTLIIIPNDRVFSVIKHGAPASDAFQIVDDVLYSAVKGISDLITKPGKINLDFADVKRVMEGRGRALMGTGISAGDDRAIEAAQTAISSPLLEDNSIDGSRGVLINITADQGVGMAELQQASTVVQNAVHEDAEIIFGWVEDNTMGDRMMVTVIATGFGKDEGERGLRDLPPWKGRFGADEDVPAFVRKSEPEKVEKTRRPAIMLIEDEEEFEVPAFLRRQAD